MDPTLDPIPQANKRIYDYTEESHWKTKGQSFWKVKCDLRKKEWTETEESEKQWAADYHGVSETASYAWVTQELEGFTLRNQHLLDYTSKEVTYDRYLFTIASLDHTWKRLNDPMRPGFHIKKGSETHEAMRVYLMATEYWILPHSPKFAFIILLHISGLMYGCPQACQLQRKFCDKIGVSEYRLDTSANHTLNDVDNFMVKIIARREEGKEDDGLGMLTQSDPATASPEGCFMGFKKTEPMEGGGRVPKDWDLTHWSRVREQQRFFDTYLNKKLSKNDCLPLVEDQRK